MSAFMFLTPSQYNEIYAPSSGIIINTRISDELHDLKKKLAESERNLSVARDALNDLDNRFYKDNLIQDRIIAGALKEISNQLIDTK